MKIIFSLALIACFAECMSQDCGTYFFLQNNKTIELSITNSRGNPEGKSIYTVSDVATNDGTTTANVQTEMQDRKGKVISKATNQIKCKGGVMMMDMRINFSNAQQNEQFKDARVKADNAYLEYPNNMSVGDRLNEGSVEMEMDNRGMQQIMTMNVSNRKVQDKEKITTPAGSWDCFKITYNANITIKMSGIGIPVNFVGTEWYAPGFGVVKTTGRFGGTEITSIK